MLKNLVDKIAWFFRPQWVYSYPDIAKLEREINTFAGRLRLPRFKVEKVSEAGDTVEIVILAHRLLYGLRRKLLLPPSLLSYRMSLRCYLWGNYLDLTFRFMLRTKVMWISTRSSSNSIVTEIYSEDYLNYICLTLERLGGKWQIELRERSDEDLGLPELKNPSLEPIRITYDNWNEAIETYIRFLWSLSMSKPAEVWATVRKLEGLNQL
jgi:hypothetical protein